ncbi:MAG: PorT family protein, partial [Bacteroidales bacterium]|nr:PorT family protein [Bacteroidales bacterium]
WEKDSTLFVELPKHVSDNESKEFNDMLYELTSDCRNIAEVTGLVRYNKKSLTAFITRYNRCDNKPFPHLKFGITGGYAVSKLSSSDAMLKKYSFPYDGSMTIGLFVDVPIMVSNYSFHADITFHQGAYSVYFRDENKNIDLLINTAAISVPFLIRYTYPSVKLSPFINMGGIYAYNFKNENTLYEATIVHDVVEINPVSDEPLLTKSLIGFSAGSGLEYRLNYRHEPGLP